jgi:hypothetical protein
MAVQVRVNLEADGAMDQAGELLASVSERFGRPGKSLGKR